MLRPPGKRRRGRLSPTPRSAQPSQPRRAEDTRNDPTNRVTDDDVRRELDRRAHGDRHDPVVVAATRRELELRAIMADAFPEHFTRARPPTARELNARFDARPELMAAAAVLARVHHALLWHVNPPRIDDGLVAVIADLERWLERGPHLKAR